LLEFRDLELRFNPRLDKAINPRRGADGGCEVGWGASLPAVIGQKICDATDRIGGIGRNCGIPIAPA
jgi:hypothetical protein